MPSRSPFGARMQWPEPVTHQAEPGASARPTKGGAVRIRIALSTATVVSITSTAFFTFLSALPAASAKSDAHHAIQSHQTSLFKLSDTSLAAFAAPITVNGPAVEVGGTPIATFASATPGPPPPPPPPPPQPNRSTKKTPAGAVQLPFAVNVFDAMPPLKRQSSSFHRSRIDRGRRWLTKRDCRRCSRFAQHHEARPSGYWSRTCP
jgi:hypothetical protein